MASDIKYYLSGGTFNISQSQSLGGLPAQQEVIDIIDGLFPRVTRQEREEGADVYRCMYVFNTGSTILENIRIWVDQNTTLSTVSLGVRLATEVQVITLSGSPYGGSFVLRYVAVINGTEVSQNTNAIHFDTDPDIMTYNIQTALNDLTLLDDIVVTTDRVDDTWRYSVSFEGSQANRKHRTLEVASNSIIGDNISITVSTSIEGSPINATAANIGFENQAPFDVEFTDNQITVGNLDLLDGMGIWFKRTTEAETVLSGEQTDSVTFNLVAQVET